MENELNLPDWLSRNIPSNDENDPEYKKIRATFLASLQNIEDWEKDQDNFKAAYMMLDTHPVFWTRDNDDPTWEWMTSSNVQNFWHGLGSDCLMMECGGHVPDDYTTHYHDLRLDVWGDDFADCIIQTAKLVHKFFYPDGNERENVVYKKSQLEIELDEAVARAKEANPEMFK